MTAIADILKPGAVKKTCQECCTTWELEFIGPLAKFLTLCPRCSDRRAIEDGKRLAAQAENRRLRAWEEICPADFLQTDPRKLPLTRQRNEVMAWKYGARGLVLHGPTGKGKSRC